MACREQLRQGGCVMQKLRVLDLFSGIGGFSLGLERTGGFETVAFCEIEPFPRRVLAKHWPEVPCYDDVRKLRGSDVGAVDVICGGFPCQDISPAGKKVGIGGARSGLWVEIARLVGELRPEYVILENSAALTGRGLGDILGDLAARGYDAEWQCIPASELGAPHGRDRIWIVAYPNAGSQSRRPVNAETCGDETAFSRTNADAECGVIPLGRIMARIGRVVQHLSWHGIWEAENSPLGMGVDDGLPDRLHRLRALGNAVVPQIPELIGHAILQARAS
jgi:DNA (cytosine-5)-methyltransferase 1